MIWVLKEIGVHVNWTLSKLGILGTSCVLQNASMLEIPPFHAFLTLHSWTWFVLYACSLHWSHGIHHVESVCVTQITVGTTNAFSLFHDFFIYLCINWVPNSKSSHGSLVEHISSLPHSWVSPQISWISFLICLAMRLVYRVAPHYNKKELSYWDDFCFKQNENFLKK